MKLEPVKSSNVHAIGWEDTGVLRVVFRSGAIYEYVGVEERVFGELLQAESVGKTFNKLVRGAYSYRLVKKVNQRVLDRIAYGALARTGTEVAA